MPHPSAPLSPYPLTERRRIARPAIPPWPNYSRLTRIALVFKRAIDIVGGVTLLLLLSPLFLLFSIWIPLDSKGPVFFTHPRRGLYGRTFRIFKFRTMTRDAHQHREKLVNSREPRRLFFKMAKDSRVTEFGKMLRKYSLDELPQLFNVLRGEMSLIGPRPLLKEDFETADASNPLYRQWVRDRHRLRPGITGLWQVSGRSHLSMEESMHLDLTYVTQWSLWMDFVILCKTPKAVLVGEGAY